MILQDGVWLVRDLLPWLFRSPVFAACARLNSLRSMVRETRLSPTSLVYPLFVCPGEGVRKEVRSMPGVFNLSVDEAVKEARETHSLGSACGYFVWAAGKER